MDWVDYTYNTFLFGIGVGLGLWLSGLTLMVFGLVQRTAPVERCKECKGQFNTYAATTCQCCVWKYVETAKAIMQAKECCLKKV